MEKSYSIGTLARLADCKATTIRWYEQRGLLPEPQRNAGNQRRYSAHHLTLLRFIRHARSLGFDLEAIRQLQGLSASSYEDHLEADRMAQEHLQAVQHKIRQLQALEEALQTMLERCHYEDENLCKVLEVLSDHTLCKSDHPN